MPSSELVQPVIDAENSPPALPIASSVSLAVYTNLRTEILSGRLAAGSRLHQAEVARRYGVSITPVREALSALTSDGLVDSNPFSGSVVHQPSAREIDEVYELRAGLVPMLVEKSVERVTPDALALARSIAERMNGADFEGVWSEGNRAFHRALDSACDNRQLLSTMGRLSDLSLSYVAISVATSEVRKAQAGDEHLRLVELYERRDVKGATEMTLEHIAATHELVRSALVGNIAPDGNRPGTTPEPTI